MSVKSAKGIGKRSYHASRFARREKALIWAHRGASRDAPENTVAAFALARAQGAEGIECDVRQCGTGEVVLAHDERLDRLSGIPVAVRDLPLAELRRQLVLRDRFPDHREGIVSLEEGIAASDPGLLWNIELKVSRHEEAVPLALAVLELVERMGLWDRALLSSFHPLALLTLRRYASRELATAYLWEPDGPLPRLWHRLWKWPTASAAVHPHVSRVNEDDVARWHRQGFLVNTWTVDEVETIRALDRVGVDGIITNLPGVAKEALGRTGSLARPGA